MLRVAILVHATLDLFVYLLEFVTRKKCDGIESYGIKNES